MSNDSFSIQKRRLGKSGLMVSNLGFGCMRLPVIDGNLEHIDEPSAIAMVRRAIDAGVNYIDTAYPYHGPGIPRRGQSEPFVGRALSNGYREKVYLATKLPTWIIESRADMDRLLDEQLKRLGVPYVDVYLAHSLNASSFPKLKKLGLLSFFDEAKRDGRIRNAAFSFHDTYVPFEEILNSYDWDVVQIQYNYLDKNYQAGERGLQEAYKRDIGVVIMEPLRGGFLINNIPEDMQAELKNIHPDWSLADWGLRWLWNQPEVGVVLSGMSTPEQVEENLRIAAVSPDPGTLSSVDIAALERVRRRFTDRITVDCTACGYCVPCPQNIRIPRIFSYYNDYVMTDDPESKERAKWLYDGAMSAQEKAGSCIGCAECVTKCPQHIPIPEIMPEIAKIFER